MKMVLMLVSVGRMCLLACLLPLMAAAAACANAGPAASTETKHPGQLSVVAAFYPFQFVAQRVAGDHARVSSLTPPGAEPHDLELTPRQVASLTTASLVIYQNGFRPAVDEAVVQSGALEVIDTSKIVPLRPLPTTEDDHGRDQGPNEPGEEELDPHVWLDPTSVSRIARTVQERLSTLDPDHAAITGTTPTALTKSWTVLIGRSAKAWRAAYGPSSSPLTLPLAISRRGIT
jgi:zinc transport system substrate-binding protein